MYQSIEQITDILPNVPDFVTHALGQPKLVFVSIFYSVSLILSSQMKNQNGFLVFEFKGVDFEGVGWL